jgi:hypothetical protein
MKTIQLIIALAIGAILPSCMTSSYQRSTSKSGMMEVGQTESFVSPIQLGFEANFFPPGNGCRPQTYGYQPQRYNNGRYPQPHYNQPRMPYPQPRNSGCRPTGIRPPGYRTTGYQQGSRYEPIPRRYPESGTSWNRNGQGYTPVGGYELPHPSGYMLPPYPLNRR